MATLGEYSKTITLTPNQESLLLIQMLPNTMISLTMYISNLADVPIGSTNTIDFTLSDWTNGLTSTFTCDNNSYGKILSNFPVATIVATNNFPVSIQLFIHYIIKDYDSTATPEFSDILVQQFPATITTNALTAGTNFRYFGTLANLNLSGMPAGESLYILDQQVYGTSSTVAGYVTVPYSGTETITINCPALGTTDWTTEYLITTDTTTQSVPGNATSSNAVMNWVVMDFNSPIAASFTTITTQTLGYYAGNYFEILNGAATTGTITSSYLTAVAAAFATISIDSSSTPGVMIYPNSTIVAGANGVVATYLGFFPVISPIAPANPAIANVISTYKPLNTNTSTVTTTTAVDIPWTFDFGISVAYSAPTVTATISDVATGNKVPGAIVNFSVTVGTMTPSSSTTNAVGQATSDYSGTGGTCTASCTIFGTTHTATVAV